MNRFEQINRTIIWWSWDPRSDMPDPVNITAVAQESQPEFENKLRAVNEFFVQNHRPPRANSAQNNERVLGQWIANQREYFRMHFYNAVMDIDND